GGRHSSQLNRQARRRPGRGPAVNGARPPPRPGRLAMTSGATSRPGRSPSRSSLQYLRRTHIMGRLKGSAIGWRWRISAVGLGMLIMVGLGLAGEDQTTSLGSGTYPAAYAIRGAKVVAAPGKVIESGTVVVRRGLIEAVGPDKEVSVPY